MPPKLSHHTTSFCSTRRGKDTSWSVVVPPKNEFNKCWKLVVHFACMLLLLIYNSLFNFQVFCTIYLCFRQIVLRATLRFQVEMFIFLLYCSQCVLYGTDTKCRVCVCVCMYVCTCAHFGFILLGCFSCYHHYFIFFSFEISHCKDVPLRSLMWTTNQLYHPLDIYAMFRRLPCHRLSVFYVVCLPCAGYLAARSYYSCCHLVAVGCSERWTGLLSEILR